MGFPVLDLPAGLHVEAAPDEQLGVLAYAGVSHWPFSWTSSPSR